MTPRLAKISPANVTPTPTKQNDGTVARRRLPDQPSHTQVLDHNTGWSIDPAVWARRREASEVLAQQSEQMVTALARKGIDLKVESDVIAISAVTWQIEKLAAYRACRFIPAVAARDRRPMLNAFKIFNRDHPGARYFRYIVATRGEVIAAGDPLGPAIKAFHRTLSKFSHWSRAQDVEVLFRGTEFTRQNADERGMTDRYPPDTALYNIHANLVTWPT